MRCSTEPWLLQEGRSVAFAQRCQFAFQQGFIAEVEFHQAPQVADRVEVDMPADEAEQLAMGARQDHFHLHAGVLGELDAGVEGVIGVAIPLRRTFYQQPLERYIMQLDSPAPLTLNDLGGGIESDALKASTLVARVAHAKTPVRFCPL